VINRREHVGPVRRKVDRVVLAVAVGGVERVLQTNDIALRDVENGTFSSADE
jgi:hypothetical protein